jgi:predicted HAD superfamily Cof-like phosphohydrolase
MNSMPNHVSAAAAMVASWYRAVGKAVRSSPSMDIPGRELRQLRRKLREECRELQRAMKRRNLVQTADALADVLYVIYGAAHQLGIPLDAVVEEVHRANMSKPNRDGSVRLDRLGGVMPGNQYEPPDVAGVLARHSRR